MRKKLKEIKQCLESTLEEYSDAYENYGHDMENEAYYVQEALNRVNELLFSSVCSRLMSDNNNRVDFRNSA